MILLLARPLLGADFLCAKILIIDRFRTAILAAPAGEARQAAGYAPATRSVRRYRPGTRLAPMHFKMRKNQKRRKR